MGATEEARQLSLQGDRLRHRIAELEAEVSAHDPEAVLLFSSSPPLFVQPRCLSLVVDVVWWFFWSHRVSVSLSNHLTCLVCEQRIGHHESRLLDASAQRVGLAEESSLQVRARRTS